MGKNDRINIINLEQKRSQDGPMALATINKKYIYFHKQISYIKR